MLKYASELEDITSLKQGYEYSMSFLLEISKYSCAKYLLMNMWEGKNQLYAIAH